MSIRVKKSTKKQNIKNESAKNIIAIGDSYLLWRFNSRDITGLVNLQPILCAIGKGKN